MVFLKDTCQRLFLYQLDSAWAVGLNDQLDREKLEQEIREFIRKSGGQVDNLSLIYEEIHKKHSTFEPPVQLPEEHPFSFCQWQHRPNPGEKMIVQL